MRVRRLKEKRLSDETDELEHEMARADDRETGRRATARPVSGRGRTGRRLSESVGDKSRRLTHRARLLPTRRRAAR